jgi:hypothetical protein
MKKTQNNFFDLKGESQMNMQETSRDLLGVLEKVCMAIEPLGEPDADGAAWFCKMENDLSCLVECNSNAEDIDIPTITIALSLGCVSDYEKEDFLDLLSRNGDFWRATLNAHMLGESWILFLQYKVMADSFKMEPAEFVGCIEHLLTQYEMFMK